MEKGKVEQYKLMAHFLGVDAFKSVISLKMKDKKLNKPYYRNYFNTAGKGQIDELVKLGFAVEFKEQYYQLTEKGIYHFEGLHSEFAVYAPKNVLDLDYLKHRIDFYCLFYHYNFGNSNSDHVIGYYVNYFLRGQYVSHTTKDCIFQFKSDLKKYHKAEILKSYSK